VQINEEGHAPSFPAKQAGITPGEERFTPIGDRVWSGRSD
jgi:hypothetical protein